MHPVAFHLFGRPIYWYGILLAAGFMAALAHWSRFARRAGQPPDRGADLALWAMVGSIVGARIAYVAANAAYFRVNPLDVIRVDRGGLIFYGGLLGGIAAVILLARRRRTPLWPLGDFAVSALPLGHAFGRIGCFLNGCCYGRPVTSAAPSVWLHEAARHPVPLYEAGVNLLLYAGIWALWLRPSRPRPGRTLALYLAGYGVGRFLLEFLRGDERLRWGGLTASQIMSLGLVVMAGLVPIMVRLTSRPESLPVSKTTG